MLTKDEAIGIGDTLRRLEKFEEVVVIDSNSTDQTVEIAESFGARVVNFTWNKAYPKKKQWSLENAGVKNEWVLLLDADEYPSDGLLIELAELQDDLEGMDVGAFDINLRYRFAGKFLRHGHVVTKRSLVHRQRAAFPVFADLAAPGIGEVEGHYQPSVVSGVGALKMRLFHDDRDPVSSWFARHNKYSDWEAHLAMDRRLATEIASKRTKKGQIFDSVPFKPVAFFLYAYVVRLGFLDGRAGFDYALALSFYYWQTGVKKRELNRKSRDG